jgi:plastocyanin
LSVPTSSNAYGIGLIAVIVGAGIGVVYYQMYYIPEYNAKPHVDPKILNPGQTTNIVMVPGAEIQTQAQNFVPKKITAQLGVSNLVIWKNTGDIGHTVDPDKPFKDLYSGNFGSQYSSDLGSSGIIPPGKTFQFLFTQTATITYHCDPHPWMTGEIDVVPGALTS